MDIRAVDLESPAEAAGVLALLEAYAADPMGDARGLPRETRETLVPALRGIPGRHLLLAWVGERPVGLAVCFQGFSTFRAQPLLNIHDLVVLRAYRGRGIGAALLMEVEAEARRRGCCKLTLEVREDNPVAAGLYRRRGYAAGRSGGHSVQYLFLEKRLG